MPGGCVGLEENLDWMLAQIVPPDEAIEKDERSDGVEKSVVPRLSRNKGLDVCGERVRFA